VVRQLSVREARSKVITISLLHLFFFPCYHQHGRHDTVLEKLWARVRRLHDGRVTPLPIMYQSKRSESLNGLRRIADKLQGNTSVAAAAPTTV
jgi:hypothetical protein